MARTYGRHPNIIYEICNEPNGPGVTWREIKSYAEFVIPAIRAIDPHNIIIVGTDNWSQGVRAASESALDFPNVMYALHFYAGTHREDLRHNADDALSRGLPIFVTEWGLTDASGKGALHMAEAQRWVDWMNAHKISWANWSFSNFDESTAALKPSVTMDGPWADADLSASGAWVKSHMGEVK
jgi:endoglucanase